MFSKLKNGDGATVTISSWCTHWGNFGCFANRTALSSGTGTLSKTCSDRSCLSAAAAGPQSRLGRGAAVPAAMQLHHLLIQSIRTPPGNTAGRLASYSTEQSQKQELGDMWVSATRVLIIERLFILKKNYWKQKNGHYVRLEIFYSLLALHILVALCRTTTVQVFLKSVD